MTDEEPSVRDEIMELYLKYGEREFIFVRGMPLRLIEKGFLWNGPFLKTKITPKALKLIGKN
jgi:hypothetical protein